MVKTGATDLLLLVQRVTDLENQLKKPVKEAIKPKKVTVEDKRIMCGHTNLTEALAT